jgi:hypothetical protein
LTCALVHVVLRYPPGVASSCPRAPGGYGRMGDESRKPPPLTRRVPGATRAAPADPERREPPELSEEVRQRIQAVVSAAHAQAARELEAQREEEARRGQPQPDQPVRHKRSAKIAHRAPNAANGATSPRGMLRPEVPTAQRQGHLSDLDAESDTSPLPRLTASGDIASPEAPDSAVKPDLANKQRHAARQERIARREDAAAQERAARQKEERARQEQERAAQERAAQERAAQERAAQERAEQEQAEQEQARQERERAAQQERERAAAQERARQEEERAAQERARQAEERAAQQRAQLEQERVRLEQERAAQQRAEQERVRLEQERASQERERAARQARELAAQQDRDRAAAQKRARQVQESLARQEQKRAAKQERAARRERAAEQKRAAKQERERAAQEVIEQERAGRERARQEQERAAEELARQLEELAAKERIRQEEEREDREWAAARRARLEREREEAEELASRERGNGAVPLPPRQLPAAGPVRAQPPARPEPRVPEAQGSPRHRTPVLIAALVVLVLVGSLVVARYLHGSGPSAGADIGTPTQNQAATWVAQQVSPSSIVSCDPVMCLVLKAHGVPTYDLLALSPTTPTPLGSQIVVATAASRNHFGSRLAKVYAPVVLASFGSGKARIDIRVTAPNGAAAYLSRLRADEQARKTNGAALLSILADGSGVTTSPVAQAQLTAGQVDSRLMVVISDLAVGNQVDVMGFGDAGPGASPGVPLRSATLTGSTASLRSIVKYLRTLVRPYRPSHVAMTRLDGEPALVIEFSAPIPLDLFDNPGP